MTNKIMETVKQNARMLKYTGTTALMVIVPSVTALAAEPGTGGTSLLTGEVKTAIQTGFNNLTASVTDVVAIAVVASVAVVSLTAAVKYAVKKVKGVISSAA